MITSVPTQSPDSADFLRSSWLNLVVRPVLLLCASLGILLLGGLVIVLTLGALGSFGQTPGPALALPSLVANTCFTAAIALVIAAPIGLFGALYLTEFSPARLRLVLEPILRFLARIPPIVYGYFAISTLLPMLVKFVPTLANLPLVEAGIALAGTIVPRFLEQSLAAIATVPQPLRDAACALGSGAFFTARFVVIPAVGKRLLTAFLAVASRAVGETMIVLVVFVTYATRGAERPETLTTFFVPNDYRNAWPNQVPKEFFLVGLALLILAFGLDAARQTLEESGKRENGP